MTSLLPFVAALGLGLGPAPEAGLHILPEPPAPVRAESQTPQDRYRVHLITIEQGDEVFEMFGHNALLIHDRETGESLAWNWGRFDFDEVDFLPRFLRGTMPYWMDGIDPDLMVRGYAQRNRTVYSQRVRLTQEEARALDDFVRWNALPENRYYVYDYFRDNCSTRIRDALDQVLGGALWEEYGDRETPHSYRWHSRRLVQVTGWVNHGLSFLLGMRGDPPRSKWEAMFIPMEMARILEGYQRPDEDGELRPLLGPREILFQADRPPPPETAPPFAAWMPLVGLVGGGLLVLLGWQAAGGAFPGEGLGRTGSRILFGAVASIWALFSGGLGGILVAAWFTDHVFIQWNLNLLYASPLAPLVLLFLLAALTSRERAAGAPGRWAAGLALAMAGLSVITALLQALTLLRQGNGEVIAVALPLNLGLAVAALLLHRRAREGPEDEEPPDPAHAMAMAA